MGILSERFLFALGNSVGILCVLCVGGNSDGNIE